MKLPAIKNNRSKMQMEGNEMPHIPNDIVIQILIRLPAKSLVRFRWACKYWFDLITKDHDFNKMHFHRSTTTSIHDDDFISSNSIILSISSQSGESGIDGYKLFRRSLNYYDTTEVVDISSDVCISLPVDNCFGYSPEILGSSNGFILILLWQGVNEICCIWNPCTKEYRVLPNPPNYIEGAPVPYGYYYSHYYDPVYGYYAYDPVYGYYCYPSYDYYYHHDHYGFGYDHTTNDYKLLRFTYYYTRNVANSYLYSQVYTLGTNSWRMIEEYTPYVFCEYQKEGVFVNGAIHWMDCLHQNIVSVNIVTEKTEHVAKLPKLGNHGADWRNVKLQVFEGSLCMVVLNIKGQRKYYCRGVEIWVMNNHAEDNNEYLWTKLTTIPDLGDCYFSIMPLRFTRNGEILMVRNQKDLLLYDPKNSNVKTLCRICEWPIYHFIAYSESLLSLNSGAYMGQEFQEPTKEEENTIMAWRLGWRQGSKKR